MQINHKIKDCSPHLTLTGKSGLNMNEKVADLPDSTIKSMTVAKKAGRRVAIMLMKAFSPTK